MRTVDAVVGNWELVFSRYGLPWMTGNKHIDCPICGSKKSFRIDNKNGNGTFICTCEAGNGWKLLMLTTGKEFKELAKEIDLILGNDSRPVERVKAVVVDKPHRVTSPKAIERERDYFISLQKIKGTQAQDYFHSRGIYLTPRSGVRYSSGEFDHDENRKIPCLYSIASNEYGEPVFKHLTYIENGEKAKIETVRKMHTIQDYPGSVAIKLFEHSSVLGVGEGIESCLSAAHIYRMPVWSTLNANLMQRFRAPTGVTGLYIFADNDKNGTGLAAAFACGRANILAKNDVQQVFIRWPAKLNDFNDMLTGGDEVIEWVLSI